MNRNGSTTASTQRPTYITTLPPIIGPDGKRHTQIVPIETVDASAPEQAPEPVEFVIDGLIPRGRLVNLSGEQGSSKTALACHAAVCIERGLRFGGHFETRSWDRPVILCVSEGEMNAQDARQYLAKVAAGESLDGVLFPAQHNRHGDLRLDHNRAIFELIIEDKRPVMVVIDSIRAWFPTVDKNDEQAANEVMAWFRAIATRYDVAIVLLHHWRKRGEKNNRQADRLAGTTRWMEACDVHLAVETRNRTPVAITLDRTRYGKPGTRWPITKDDMVYRIGDQSVAHADPNEERLIEYLRANGPTNRPGIEKALALSEDVAYRLATKLVKDGRIKSSGPRRARVYSAK